MISQDRANDGRDQGTLTFPGIKSSPILAPLAGTSLEFSEVVVGAIRKDSLITAVCRMSNRKQNSYATFWLLFRDGVLPLPSKAVSRAGLL